MCLDVRVLDKNDEEIDLREYDDDVDAEVATPEILAELKKNAELNSQEEDAAEEKEEDIFEEDLVFDGGLDVLDSLEDQN